MNPQSAGETLETLLRTLAPTPPALERERLMYLAGQAAARPARFWGDAHWGWPASLTGVSALAAAALLALLLRGAADPLPDAAPILIAEQPPLPAERESAAHDGGPAAPAPALPTFAPPGLRPSPRGEWADRLRWRDVPAEGGYLAVRERVAAWGVSAWPAPRVVAAALPAAGVPPSRRELLDELLDLPRSPDLQQPAVAPAEET